METHDHKSPISSGNDGHGGVHVCHKCGWAFPNHHPSSKQRRAHKRICGSTEGHLDNIAEDKTRMEGDVGGLKSDDELKTPSGKVGEMTISRRSSSGVGSKSGRSEEDVFTEADTEFNENSGTISREASDGGLQRYYSIQNGNELKDSQPAEENSAAESILSYTGKKQTLQRVEGETDNSGAVVGQQDLISTSPLVSAAVALTNENTVDQNTTQSYDLSQELDIVSESDIEIISSKAESDISFTATPNDVDSPDKDKTESNSEVKSAENFKYSSGIPTQGVGDPGNSNITKSDQSEELDSKLGDSDNSGHNAENLSLSEVTDSAGESVEYSKANVVDEANLGDYERECSEEVVCSTVDKQEDNKNFVDEENIIQEPEKSDVGINILSSELIQDLKGNNLEENHMENIVLEGVTKDAGLIQETTSNDYSNVKDDDSGKVPEDEFSAGNSTSFKPIVDEVPSQEMGNVDNITLEVANLNGKEMGGELVEKVSTEIDGNVTDNVADKISESGAVLITQREEFIDDTEILADDVIIRDDQLNSISKLEMDEDAQTSAVENLDSIDKFTEKSSCTAEGDEIISQNITIPAVDTIVDSGSQADSLDGNWGSVSVLSTISDAQPTESPVKVPKPVMNNNSVNTEVEIERLERVSEIQTSKEEQLINSSDIPNEPEQGNKDKEIIAKVANWNSGSQRTPLKTLLGEAIAKSRAESPIHHNHSSASTSTSVPMPPETNNGFDEKIETSVVKFDDREMEEMGKEWDSPAKYPVKIKTEKRRNKSKPIWAPFLCCSSVNAR